MYRYVRTNMTTGNVRVFALPRDRWVLGGRGLISRVLYTEMDPSSDPLGPKNVLVLASGIFAGCPLSCFDEVFFGAKSPSTGRLESVRFMSRAARLMASMDIRLAIFEGQAPEGKQYVLLMDRGSASLLPLEESEATPDEMGGYALHDALQRQFGKNACIVSWGHPAVVHSPGASLLVSGVSGGHLKNIPGRGISAVMASKGLRAIVLRSGASLSSMYTRGKKADSVCRDTECLLCCARLHNGLENTPYGQANLCHACMEQPSPVPPLEKACADLGLHPSVLSPDVLPLTCSDETELRNLLIKQAGACVPGSCSESGLPFGEALAAFDSMGLCPRALKSGEHDRTLLLMADLAAAVYGGEWSRDTLLRMGADTLAREKAFNNWAAPAAHE